MDLPPGNQIPVLTQMFSEILTDDLPKLANSENLTSKQNSNSHRLQTIKFILPLSMTMLSNNMYLLTTYIP